MFNLDVMQCGLMAECWCLGRDPTGTHLRNGRSHGVCVGVTIHITEEQLLHVVPLGIPFYSGRIRVQ